MKVLRVETSSATGTINCKKFSKLGGFVGNFNPYTCGQILLEWRLKWTAGHRSGMLRRQCHSAMCVIGTRPTTSVTRRKN